MCRRQVTFSTDTHSVDRCVPRPVDLARCADVDHGEGHGHEHPVEREQRDGAGIGDAVARTFARDGAQVFLTGRTREPQEAVAEEIKAAGGTANVAVVDALDEAEIGRARRPTSSAAPTCRLPPVEMTTDDLLRAPITGLPATSGPHAARRMIAQRSSMILHRNSASDDASMPGMGSTGPADAAIEPFMRSLAAEVEPSGVRVCGIWTAGVRTLRADKLGGVDAPDRT